MILVLPNDPQVVDEVRRRAEALGWSCESSEGAEQVVLVASGGSDPTELALAFEDHDGVDVIPLLSGREYRRQRSRRGFLTALAAGLGLMTTLGFLIPVLAYLAAPPEPLFVPDLVRAAEAEQLAPNSARQISFRGKPVLLIQRTSGRYFALDARCTYMDNCQLEWARDLRQIVCPCHGCIFDVYGNIVYGPPSLPLATHEAVLMGGGIFVRARR